MVHQNFKAAVIQAAPVFMDLQATLAKTIKLIDEAAANGAKLVAFPETWLPGYPWWLWLGAPAWGLQFVCATTPTPCGLMGPRWTPLARLQRAAIST